MNIAELVNKHRQGNDTARDELIVALHSIAVDAATRGAIDKHDAASCASLALVELVDKLRAMEHPPRNVSGWVRRAVSMNVLKEQQRSTGFGPLEGFQTKNKERIEPPTLAYVLPTHLGGARVDDFFAQLELVDELEACCANDVERKVLKLLTQNETPGAIAYAIGSTIEHVKEITTNIAAAYRERNNETT